MDPQIRKSKSISIFKSNILKFIRPKPNNVYYCHNTKKIKLLTRLRLGLRYFCELKFKHSFQDCLNPLWLCGNEIETSIHYLLHCPTYTNERLTLLNKIQSINCSILESSDAAVTKMFLFGDNTLSSSSNTIILNSTIEYIISTQRFEGSILKAHFYQLLYSSVFETIQFISVYLFLVQIRFQSIFSFPT